MTDTYAFTVAADDGVRLWLDDRLVVDRWIDQPATPTTVLVPVTAGDHTVRVEYYEHLEAASLRAAWAPTAPQAPVAVIDAPTAGQRWSVGDVVAFGGHATDGQQGALPASALTWTLVMRHCPDSCHSHPIQTFEGVASGSFVAPDHDHPSHLELVLTATDAQGNTHTVTRRLDPATVELSFATEPAGLALTVNGAVGTAPFTRTVIAGSTVSVTAAPTQALAGSTYRFTGWSDGGAATHNLTAPDGPATVTARYAVTGQ